MNNSLRDTIEPKSDQLNADDLIAGPLTVTVTDVRLGPTIDQPVEIVIQGHRPYRPCKSMRRVLIAAWGDNGKSWAGKSMTLFCDPGVKFGGVAVGGIRISHLSGIDRDLSLLLTTTRSKRSAYTVHPLESVPVDYPQAEFERNFQAWVNAVGEGKISIPDIIQRASAKGRLTVDQISDLKSACG